VLDVIETHPHIPHRQRLLAASVAGLPSPAGRFLRERLPRWTLAPHPLPPGLFHHLGRPASDTELGEPLWPVLVAALAMEDPGTGATASPRSRLGEGGNETRSAGITASYGYGGLMTAEFRANDLLLAAEMRARRGRPQ
jgi:hypothetical protein